MFEAKWFESGWIARIALLLLKVKCLKPNGWTLDCLRAAARSSGRVSHCPSQFTWEIILSQVFKCSGIQMFIWSNVQKECQATFWSQSCAPVGWLKIFSWTPICCLIFPPKLFTESAPTGFLHLLCMMLDKGHKKISRLAFGPFCNGLLAHCFRPVHARITWSSILIEIIIILYQILKDGLSFVLVKTYQKAPNKNACVIHLVL